ncbi:ATP-binding protein [Anabaena sp. FACHB-709]|uniref:Circadian input-output histidine kinase CikA n=2 Tax=Nostocaceae TaxID=1162 RepID=A0A1Z4KEL2_ANAVA|nr:MULTISPECIES: ATP-binding protein [Nostocaceae]BAY67420.1 two-component hybrid sensor and regulator [Trichormus variabilis NIES-23]HBW30904.1 PAS domain S-box protein [Nostoc sp. UBA8866]MBD2173361.1 PAS domain S-box protein [Anabaena cylindrica FACHB-318]MBD2265111.1 PAS domain S-box protein [Anabaena sp. FACHB-709]MBD2274422.1 PAS domain S-box protein [Nostoc sp. PCC 7120 = FACHB-418]
MLEFNHLRLHNMHGSLVAKIASAIATLVSSSILIGWLLDIQLLKTFFWSSSAIMKPNTALCFTLCGISAWLLVTKPLGEPHFSQRHKPYKKLSRAFSVSTTIIAGLKICEYLFGWELGIDKLLLGDVLTTINTPYPGRMGLNTAINFLLIGIALELLIYPRNHRSYWYAQMLVLFTTVISLQVVVSYAYKVKFSYTINPNITSMSLQTALLFIVLCIGILSGRAEKGLMKIVFSDSYGGLIARRLLVAAIAVPLFLGWLILEGQRAGRYGPAFAVSVFAVILIVIFAIIIWQNAVVIELLSQQRDRAQETLKAYEEKLASLVDANIIGIIFSDIYGGIQQANEAFLMMVGYSQEDLLTGRLNWKNITPPEYIYLDEQGIAEAQVNPKGACTPYEKEYIHQDGSRIPVLIGYVLLGEKREESVAFILDLSERQQAQQKILQLNKDLQRRVVELQTLLDVIPIGIGIAEDPECQHIKINPAFAKQLQLSTDVNASLSAPPDQRPTTFKVFHEGRELLPAELPMQYSAAHGAEVLDYEVDIVHDNGEIIKLLEYVAPLFDEDGNTRGCIGAFVDITERKQAEELLRNEQKWLEDVLNLMPRPLLFIEPETARVTFANRAADELAGGEFPRGVAAEEYHTVYHFTDINGNPVPNEQMPGVRVARGERLEGLELDWHTNDEVLSLLIFADTLPAMHGYPATCVVVFQNITQIKQAEKALSLGYQRLKLLFSTANDLLSSQEPVALIDSCFQKLAQQIGLDVYLNYLVEDNPQSMRLASYRGICPELAQEIEFLRFGEAVCGTTAQERHSIALENVQQSTDPKTQLIRSVGINAYYSYPLIAQGRLLGTLSFGSRSRANFTDNQKGMMQAVCDQIAIAMERVELINSLQRQTEQLTEANRMKDEFLAILSHELRSPLNAILGWAQLLQARRLSEAQTAKGLETIERNAKAQTQLIEDLLDISRMIRGKLRLNVRTCNLIPIIETAIENINLAAQAKEIDLTFFLENPATENLPFQVSGDSERLQQVIWNLLTNAIKFTPSGGKVEVRLTKNPGCEQNELITNNYAQIQVIDTGIGINSSFLPYVFDRFRQADSSITRSHGGLGLGLAIVRHLVELHGGTVHVHSPGEEQGSTFTVKLPLLSENKATSIEPISPRGENLTPLPLCPSLLGVRVLVVDDESDSRDFISTVLEQCQAQVRAVATAKEALQIISQWKPDVLVSDIGMPEEDGYSLIRKLRSLPPEQGGNIPATALTAYARAEDRTRAIQEGFQLHLPKPIEPTELATVVASLIKRGQ